MIRIIIILLFFNGFVFAQNSGDLYKYIHFENFIENKVKNDSIFMLKMYEAIGGYPEFALKNLVEAKIEVMAIKHGDSRWSFILSREACLFNLTEEDEFEKIFYKNTKEEYERFFTHFYIVYDLEPWRDKEDAYHKKYQGLVNKNSFVVLGYMMPKGHYYEY